MKTINSFRSKLLALTLALMASVSTFAYKSQWCDTWNVMWFDGWRFEETASTSQYRLGKDTIIGDYVYSKFTSRTSVRFTNDRKVYVYYEGFDDNDPYTEDLPTGEYLAYDFSAQVGDTLEVFSGIGTYSTYSCIVYDVQTDSETNLRNIMLHPLCVVDEDGNVEVSGQEITWIEGVGSPEGFLISCLPCGWAGGGTDALLCAYRGDELRYTGDLYEEYGCEYNASEQNPEDLFPTLWGLQRTDVELHTTGDDEAYRSVFNEYVPTLVNGKWYLYDGRNYLREENNQVLLYAPEVEIYEDIVLYDWTLEVGDTLPYHNKSVYRESDYIVTDVSTIILLDGKEYKKWTLACGYEYIESIGAINGHGYGLFLCLPHYGHWATYIHTSLVCASRNGKLLYQMDDAEMERLGAECLCDIETSYKDQWCDTWNVMLFDGMRFDETASTSQYRLGKDTIIGDYVYSKFTSRTSVRFTSDRKVYVYYEGFDDNDPYTVDLPTGEYLAYDFSAQVGDTLEVFSGIGTYSTYSCVVYDVETAPSPCVVDDVQADLKTFPLIIKLRPLCDVDGEGNMDISSEEITWIEGVGSPEGFLISYLPGHAGGGTFALLCAYKGDELKYTGSLYDEYGCEYNATEQNPEDLFPTLWGLQRTGCTKTIGEDENGTVWGSRSYLMQEIETATIGGKQYLLFGTNNIYDEYCSLWLREENNKILVYSTAQKKDLVLYDFTLNVGDSLPRLYVDYDLSSVVDYDNDEWGLSPLVVTEVSTITLLDGKEYKKWTFDNGMRYVEGIGSFGTCYAHNDFYQLIANAPLYSDVHSQHLVCVSKNGQLLYQMDDAEMERLGAECLCDVETSYKSQWCDTWNVLQHSTGINYEPNLGEETWIYYLAKDTIINNLTYTSVYRYWSIKDLSTSAYYAAVRFTEDKKVYVYYDNKEYLVYDFLAQVGDTLQVFGGYHYEVCNTMPCVVHEVKTDSITNRTLMKLYAINVHDGTICNGEFQAIEWIEGVGSIRGLLTEEHPCIAGGLRHHLLCAHHGDDLEYAHNSLYGKYGCEYNAEAQNNWSDTWCNQWNILSHGYQGPQYPLVAAHTSIFWLSNNTVNRDGQEYIPLMCSSSKPDVESTNLIGELRFTEDKQVYFYYDNTEYLLYDFDVQVGDTLDIFGGIELYSYSFVEQKTYPHVITKIDTLDDGRLQITSDAIVIFEDGEVGTFEEKQQQIWIEGLGSINGIVHTGINPGIAGNPAIVMLCAYRDDECVYKTDSNDPYWIDYTQLGCVYNEGDFIEGAFPILSGLQRTVYDEFCGEAEIGAVYTGKQTFDKIFFENDKPYILCNDYLLREEDNKILIYSQLLNKDLVLYDFTLEVGDSLPALYIDYHARNAMDWMPYNPDVVDYNIDFDGTIYPADTFVVTDVSNVTLLDGKEYKKWTFDNGMEYVEGIGMYGGRRNGNFFGLIQEVVVPCHIGTHLVCVSKNGQLLYQMDDAEMERLGAECLCDYIPTIKDNAKNGKIGGRPTPTQWYVLDIETKDMGDPRPTVLRAETFSYTLENDSIVVNGRTFYQLACQSTKDTATTKSVVGALHFSEDKGNHVYFLRDGVEYLLYDFTAEPGDTIQIFAGINNYPQETTYTHVVADKDTTEDGACRMFLEVVFPEETTTVENAEKVWLAGLGSIDGIVHNTAKRASVARSSETQTSIMLCAWREDDCLYTTNHPDYQTLGCVYNIDETTAVDDIHTSPSYQKLLRDGQLLIIYEGKTYNVMGVAIE